MSYMQRICCLKNISADVYWNNIYHVAAAGIIQLVGFVYIVAISVIKPWKKKNANQPDEK